MTRIRRINVSQVEGGGADSTDTNEIRPFGEIAVYLNTEPNPDKLTLMMFDGTRTHLKSMVLAPGRLYGSDADSGDGNNRDTIKLIPDASLSDYTGNDQYLIIDPTGGIRIRAGGTIDNSNADLYLGGEKTFVRVSDTTDDVVIRTGLNAGIENIEVNAVDEWGPPEGPGGVWRLFIGDEAYPTLGTTVQIGETVTTSWGTPITATIVDIQQDAGNWQIHVDQDITAGHNPYNTVTFNRGSKTWTFSSTGDLILPETADGQLRLSGSEIAGVDNNSVALSSNTSVVINTYDPSIHTWLFDNTGNLTLPVDGDILDSSGNSVLGSIVDTNVWVETFDSDTAGDFVQYATSVEYDGDGNVIALFSHLDTNSEPDTTYISVAKFDTAGTRLWSARFASGQESDGWGLAVDSQAIYVAGTLDGAGSPGAEGQAGTLIKINTTNGNVIWMKGYDFNQEQGYSKVVDVASDGHPVMVGYAYLNGNAYVSTTKIDKDTGDIIWSRKLDGQNGEYAYGMAVGPTGEIVVIGYMDNVGVVEAAATLYTDPVSNPNWTTGVGISISGEFSCTVSFVDGVPTFTNIVDYVGNRTVDGIIGTINGASFGGVTGVDDMILKVGSVTAGDNADKMLVVKYDSTGTIAWQKAIEFDEGVNCTGADADIDSAGNIYVCGTYTRPDAASPWNTAMSLIKLEDDGTKVWSRRVVGDCEDFASSVVVGPDNCLYLAGVTGTDATDDYTFVIAKYSTTGQVLWQRLLDNTTSWTFGGNWFSAGGGSNIAVKNGYVAVAGGFGFPGPTTTAFIAQINSSGSLFATGDWDFKGASFSGILNNTASDIVVMSGGKTDTDDSGNITTSTLTPNTEIANFLVTTRYGLSASLGDLTVVGNTLRGTGSNDGFQGLNLAPGPNLDPDMYFRIHGGDDPTHLHLSVGDTAVYDQYFGNDNKYLKLSLGGAISIGTNSNVWQFGTDGSLTLPSGMTIETAYGGGPRLVIDGKTNYVDIRSDGNILIGYNESGGNVFIGNGTSGQVDILGPKFRVTATVPTSSTGADGDMVGMIAVGGGYLYVCTANWVSPGTADIWTRTALTTGAW